MNAPDNEWASIPQPPPKFPADRMDSPAQDRFVGLPPIDPSALSPHDGECIMSSLTVAASVYPHV